MRHGSCLPGATHITTLLRDKSSNSPVALELFQATCDLLLLVRPVPLSEFWKKHLQIFFADGTDALQGKECREELTYFNNV
jgi:hypothetical protein